MGGGTQGGGSVGPPPEGLRNGIIVRFVMGPEQFQVWVTDGDAIRRLIEIYEGRDVFTHFSAPIRIGSGPEDHNHPWSWHLSGNAVVNLPPDPLYMFNGLPRDVETRRDQLIAGNRHFSISSVDAVLTQLHDYR